jgi:transcriptional regulator with XRE-family HTH domain
MNDFTEHDEELIAAFLDHAITEESTVDELPSHLREEAAARLSMLRSIAGAPSVTAPGAFDRIAQRFGFDRPTSIDINGRRIKSRRESAGLTLTAFVDQLRQAGVNVTARECLRWQQLASLTVDRHTATALSAILNVPVSDFEAFTVETNEAQRFLASPEFDRMIATWCAEHSRERTATKQEVTRQVVAAGYRADEVTVDHLVAIVRQILEGLE